MPPKSARYTISKRSSIEPEDRVGADRLRRIDAAHFVLVGPDDLRLDLSRAQVAPPAFGKRQQQTVHERQALVGELEADGPDVLVDDEQSAVRERAPNLVEHVLESLDVVESLGGEDCVVSLRLKLDHVQVADSVGDAVAEPCGLGLAASDLDRLRREVEGLESLGDVDLEAHAARGLRSRSRG